MSCEVLLDCIEYKVAHHIIHPGDWLVVWERKEYIKEWGEYEETGDTYVEVSRPDGMTTHFNAFVMHDSKYTHAFHILHNDLQKIPVLVIVVRYGICPEGVLLKVSERFGKRFEGKGKL